MSTTSRETTEAAQRQGVLVQPENRLNADQVRLIDGVSRELLQDPGILSYNPKTTELFRKAGATIEDAGDCQRIRISETMLDEALASAPSTVVLGARNPDNRLILDAHEPRVRFGSGSETNVWLDVSFDGDKPVFKRESGSIERLTRAAHLCDNLENLDFFIRCVNIQDKDVTENNKDVNKFLASLNNITKHVQAGLTDINALDDVVKLGQIIAGGEKAFVDNPVLSFITCVIKSPFQIVEDTAEKLMAIAERRVPVVISSCPMGGATGAFDEFSMVAQINAELLTGVMITQLVSPGAPVLYGAVPVRTRLDNLNDMYGAPEFVHYNADCAQMARHYGLPCYSTSGVADAAEPGIQATVEKLMTYLTVPRSGAQYIHYAFGLLERTNVFCPEQAVMDNAHIDIAKRTFASPAVTEDRREDVLATMREIMQTDHKTFIYHLPIPTQEDVYLRYPLENDSGALRAAHERYHEILKLPSNTMNDDLLSEIRQNVPGVLDATLQ